MQDVEEDAKSAEKPVVEASSSWGELELHIPPKELPEEVMAASEAWSCHSSSLDLCHLLAANCEKKHFWICALSEFWHDFWSACVGLPEGFGIDAILMDRRSNRRSTSVGGRQDCAHKCDRSPIAKVGDTFGNMRLNACGVGGS